MWVRDTGRRGSLRGVGGRLSVLDIVVYNAVSQHLCAGKPADTYSSHLERRHHVLH